MTVFDNRATGWIGAAMLGLGLVAAPVLAQPITNVLVNGDFEVSPPNSCGNHYPYAIAPWQVVAGAPSNVIGVDAGVTCNYGVSGPAVDAQPAAGRSWQHYLDLLGDGAVYQQFTVPSCAGSTAPRTATFSGAFSSRDGTSAGSGSIELRAGAGVGGALLASVATTAGALSYQSWTALSGTAALTPGATVSFVVNMSNPTNFDNASVTFAACPVAAGAPTAVPVNDGWALLGLAGALGWLARRQLRQRARRAP